MARLSISLVSAFCLVSAAASAQPSTVTPTSAQANPSPKTERNSSVARYGPIVGLNVSSFDIEFRASEPVEFGTRTGVTVGGFIQWQLSSSFALQAQLLYSQRGASFEVLDFGGITNTRFQLAYLDAPLLARYTVETGDIIRPSVYVGGMPSFLLSATLDVDGDAEDIDLKDSMTSMDLAGVFGAGIEIQLPRRAALQFDVRYSVGIRDIIEDEQDDGDIVRNRTITITAGYLF